MRLSSGHMGDTLRSRVVAWAPQTLRPCAPRAASSVAWIVCGPRLPEGTEQIPKRVIADAGYKNERYLERLQALGIDGYVSIGREGKSARLQSETCPCSQAMLKKLGTKRGRARYRKRKAIVEPVFGGVKRVLGFRAFSLRGLRKVAGGWSLVCLALNLRRMATKGVQL